MRSHENIRKLREDEAMNRRTALIAGLSLMIAACSSSSSSGGTGVSTSTDLNTTTVETTPDTTAASTTAAPTTVPAPIVFTLRGDGLGPFDLGVPAGDLIAALEPAFGPATSDDSVEYPVDDGAGGFQSTEGDVSFVAPFGRTMCWPGELCVQFSGADATTQTFVGWTYGDETDQTIVSSSGVTTGSLWSDFPAMVVDPGGCYTVGYGTIDGIHLTLQSSDVAFGSFDNLGNYVEAVPPADQVTVVYMETGDNPIFLFGDC